MPFRASRSCQAGQVGGFHATNGTENCWERRVDELLPLLHVIQTSVPREGWLKQPKWWEEEGG